MRSAAHLGTANATVCSAMKQHENPSNQLHGLLTWTCAERCRRLLLAAKLPAWTTQKTPGRGLRQRPSLPFSHGFTSRASLERPTCDLDGTHRALGGAHAAS
jgi:hypothetical protein